MTLYQPVFRVPVQYTGREFFSEGTGPPEFGGGADDLAHEPEDGVRVCHSSASGKTKIRTPGDNEQAQHLCRRVCSLLVLLRPDVIGLLQL